MTFFKKKRKVKIKGIYVVTALIISSYNDGNGCGPKCANWYFLAECKNGEYYELFSGRKLKKEEDTHKDGIDLKNFDTPYVKKAEPLHDYLKNPDEVELDIESLFNFITDMNVRSSLGAFSD